MVFTEMDNLENRINELKKKIILIAKETGLNSHDTINCSQKLDQLIVVYQKRLQNIKLIASLRISIKIPFSIKGRFNGIRSTQCGFKIKLRCFAPLDVI